MCSFCLCSFFFFKQKTAYEMRISDWSSDVCSSDLDHHAAIELLCAGAGGDRVDQLVLVQQALVQARGLAAAQHLGEQLHALDVRIAVLCDVPAAIEDRKSVV